MGSKVTVAALSRGLSLLTTLERSGRAMSLADLARASGLHKSTALRLLDTLRESGYVQRSDARYELGGAALRLGLSYQRANLLHLIRPTLMELLKERYDNPSFHMRYSTDARVCVLHAETRDGEHDCISRGDILPIQVGAPSRVLSKFEKGAPAGNRVGAIVSQGERVRGHIGVSAPVFGAGDRLWGALAVCGPREHFGPSSLDRICQRVVRAAAALSGKLGSDPEIFAEA